MRQWQKILGLLLCLASVSCVSTVTARYGVQSEYLAHIPARIAVLPCRLWPQGARFEGQPATELPGPELQLFCQSVDQFILQGFEGQPYMRGLSPRVVAALLEKNGQKNLLTQLEQLWFSPGQSCSECEQAVTFYREVIAPRNDWRSWLAQLSRAASSSDAILLPMLVHVGSQRINDRGLAYAQRRATLALLLIDTNNGQLIWIGGRSAEVRKPLRDKEAAPRPEDFPPWEDLWRRLFVEDLWQEFPGRQT